MHYGANDFALEAGKPVLVTVPPGIPIGQTATLSSGDIDAIRRIAGVNRPYVVDTNPSGLPVMVDGAACQTPCVFTDWTEGSQHTVEAAETQPPAKAGENSWYFARWNDDRERVHTIVLDSTHRVFAANYSVKAATNSKIDLVVESFTAPTIAVVGGWMKDLRVTVRNIGAEAAGRFRVGFYLSPTPEISVADYYIQFRCWFQNGLQAGEAGTCTGDLRLPDTINVPDVYLGALADDLLDIPEANELNNGRPNDNGPIHIQFPDLKIVSFKGPTLLAPGVKLDDLSITVRNDGEAMAKPFRIDMVLSAGSSFDRSNALETGWYCNVPSSMLIGTEYTCNGSVQMTRLLPIGTYYLIAVADLSGQVSESNRDNNWMANQNGATRVALPDLAAVSFTTNTRITPDGKVVIASSIRNIGEAPAGGFRVDYFLSGNDTFTASDTHLTTCEFKEGLAAGKAETCNGEVPLPKGLRPGTYYAGMIVDLDAKVIEPDKKNNVRLSDSGPVKIIVPDLMVTSFTVPAAITPGLPFKLTATIRNAGEGDAPAFRLGNYISQNNTLTVKDTLFSTCSFREGLKAGATETCTSTLALPAAYPIGAYVFGAIVDDTQIVLESDEDNNVKTNEGGSVSVVLPDLALTSVAVPARVQWAANFDYAVTIKNQGLGVAGPFVVYLAAFERADRIGTAFALGECPVIQGLAAGATQTCRGLGRTAASYVRGKTMYVFGMADPRSQVREPDKENNLRQNDLGPVTFAR
jgi:subtilase family serine protease